MKIRFLALTIICLSLVSCGNPSAVQDINVIFHVQGKVIDAEDGSPIADAFVTIYLGYFGQSEFCGCTNTDINGEYKCDRCKGYTKSGKCWWQIEAGLNVVPEIYESSYVDLQCTSELQTINFALKRVSGDSQIQSDRH